MLEAEGVIERQGDALRRPVCNGRFGQGRSARPERTARAGSDRMPPVMVPKPQIAICEDDEDKSVLRNWAPMVTEAQLAAYCTTPGATISNYDRLRPSSETTATVIGETIPGPTLWLVAPFDAGIRMPRDADPFEPIAIHTLCLSIRWLSRMENRPPRS